MLTNSKMKLNKIKIIWINMNIYLHKKKKKSNLNKINMMKRENRFKNN